MSLVNDGITGNSIASGPQFQVIGAKVYYHDFGAAVLNQFVTGFVEVFS